MHRPLTRINRGGVASDVQSQESEMIELTAGVFGIVVVAMYLGWAGRGWAERGW